MFWTGQESAVCGERMHGFALCSRWSIVGIMIAAGSEERLASGQRGVANDAITVARHCCDCYSDCSGNTCASPKPWPDRFVDGNGTLVAQTSDTLAPRQKAAKILSHPVAGIGFFTQPITLGSGHVEVVSDYGLLGFELFFTEDYSQLASVPAQIGN